MPKLKHKQKFHKVHSSVNIANNTLRTPTTDEKGCTSANLTPRNFP